MGSDAHQVTGKSVLSTSQSPKKQAASFNSVIKSPKNTSKGGKPGKTTNV